MFSTLLMIGQQCLAMYVFRGVPYVYNVPDLQVDVARELGFLESSAALSMMTKLENLFLRQAHGTSPR